MELIEYATLFLFVRLNIIFESLCFSEENIWINNWNNEFKWNTYFIINYKIMQLNKYEMWWDDKLTRTFIISNRKTYIFKYINSKSHFKSPLQWIVWLYIWTSIVCLSLCLNMASINLDVPLSISRLPPQISKNFQIKWFEKVSTVGCQHT